MNAFLWFLLGNMTGSALGVVMMCLVQINRDRD